MKSYLLIVQVFLLLVLAGCSSDSGSPAPPIAARTHLVEAAQATLTPTAAKDEYTLVMSGVPVEAHWFSAAAPGGTGSIAMADYLGETWRAAYGETAPHALVQLFGTTPQLDSSWYTAIIARSYDAAAQTLTLRLRMLNTVWYSPPSIPVTSRTTVLTIFNHDNTALRAGAFVQHAPRASLAPTADAGVYTLVLENISPVSSYVTKAPLTKSHFSPVDVIARQWSERFQGAVPQAALYGSGQKAQLLMMSIDRPLYQVATGSLAYAVRLPATPAELTLTDVALVVDASQAQFSADEYPFAPGCAALDSAAWNNATLYDLTYGCLPAGWAAFFNDPQVKAQVSAISQALSQQSTSASAISPGIARVFRTLYMTSPNEVKALVLGQDPAPTPGLATGLSFSLDSSESTANVPSVQRVLLELQNERFSTSILNGDLSTWAEDGVLLLNAALTIPCPPGASSCTIGGHINLWKAFTAQLIQYIDQHAQPMAYILWGSAAGQYAEYARNPQHTVLKGGHPSPQANGAYFFCKSYFSCANQWLQKAARGAVNWNLTTVANPAAEVCIWGWSSSGKSSYCQETCTMASCSFTTVALQTVVGDWTDRLRYYQQLLMLPLQATI